MSPVISEHARARLITDGPDHLRAVPVDLRYDPEDTPGVVRVAFAGGAEWVVGRELLETGLRSPVERGGMRVWPCGRAQLIVERHLADGVQVCQFDVAPLIRFLHRTHRTHREPATRTPAGRPPAAGAGVVRRG